MIMASLGLVTPRESALMRAAQAQGDAETARETAEWCAKQAAMRERAAMNYRYAEAMALEYAHTRTRDANEAKAEAEKAVAS